MTAPQHHGTTAPQYEAPLGIYIHIPFCVRKCHYCDFNSGPLSEKARRLYLEALEEEIRNTSWKGCPARTVFFGGGTPSELTIVELQALVTALTQTFAFQKDAEWSIECNPGTMSQDFFPALRELGFNRVSLGVQSFEDFHLEALGRIHNAEQARAAYCEFRLSGFDNVNLDLIFALPGQTLGEWRADLEEALRLAPEHLSLYNLTIEPGTEFGNRLAGGELEETDEDLAADMYELAMDLTRAAGFEQYEISNYSRPGRKCAHNLIYWRNQPYLGFGVSASSFVGGTRWTHTGSLTEYLRTASSGRVTRASVENLNDREALGEEIMLGLRTEEGISPAALSIRYSYNVASLFSQTFETLSQNGLLWQENDRIRLTRRGKMLANEVCARFLAG
jgi:oxygen-independent coproporphyrinogen-3 oxidase